MKEVTLHQQEQARLHVLNSVLAEEITIGLAAELMDLSERHVRRLLAAYREFGAEALAHGNRGRRPHNAVPEAVTATVVRLAATRYGGANHTHLTELIEEQAGLGLSRSTVRRILTRAGMPSPRRRRPPRHRVRRERMPREGMLLQVDGSHHAWLEQLWAMLPERGADTEVLVLLEPTSNAWVPLAAWFRRRGARVVLVPPERSADLRDYYHKHTRSDRLDSRLLARLPLLHPEGLHDEHGDRATPCGARRGCARAWCSAARSRWRGSTRCWSCSGQSGWRPSAPTSPTRPRCVSSQPDTPVPTP